MCRSIKTLRGDASATDDDVRAAALQFVRKVSGYRQPSRRNADAFERAVDEIADASRKMLEALAPVDGGQRSEAGSPPARRARAG